MCMSRHKAIMWDSCHRKTHTGANMYDTEVCRTGNDAWSLGQLKTTHTAFPRIDFLAKLISWNDFVV